MSTHTVDPELMDILRCPLTRSRLRSEGEFLVAEVGGLAYPVRGGILKFGTEIVAAEDFIFGARTIRRRYAGLYGGNARFQRIIVDAEGFALFCGCFAHHQRAANLDVIAVHAGRQLGGHKIAWL